MPKTSIIQTWPPTSDISQQLSQPNSINPHLPDLSTSSTAISPTSDIHLFTESISDVKWSTHWAQTGQTPDSPVFVHTSKTLTVLGQPGGQSDGALLTQQHWQNYKLSFNWRWHPQANPSSKLANAGILLHAQPAPGQTPYITGIEIQLRQQEAGDLYGVGVLLIGRNRHLQTGNHIRRQWPNSDHSGRSSANELQLENPVGQWNRAEIICTPGLIQVWINGYLVNEAGRLGRHAGPIAIQAEDSALDFQHITLQPIPPSP